MSNKSIMTEAQRALRTEALCTLVIEGKWLGGCKIRGVNEETGEIAFTSANVNGLVIAKPNSIEDIQIHEKPKTDWRVVARSTPRRTHGRSSR